MVSPTLLINILLLNQRRHFITQPHQTWSLSPSPHSHLPIPSSIPPFKYSMPHMFHPQPLWWAPFQRHRVLQQQNHTIPSFTPLLPSLSLLSLLSLPPPSPLPSFLPYPRPNRGWCDYNAGRCLKPPEDPIDTEQIVSYLWEGGGEGYCYSTHHSGGNTVSLGDCIHNLTGENMEQMYLLNVIRQQDKALVSWHVEFSCCEVLKIGRKRGKHTIRKCPSCNIELTRSGVS